PALEAGSAPEDSSARSADRAIAPNPEAHCLSMRRRDVNPQSKSSTVRPSSVDGDEFVGHQDRLAEGLPGKPGSLACIGLLGLELPREPIEERCRPGHLRRPGGSAVGTDIEEARAPRVVARGACQEV